MSPGHWRTWEDFLQPGRIDVLCNRFGIADPVELARVERNYATVRTAELGIAPLPGNFDLMHLQAIHRYIFGDVYEWAGVLRSFPMSKGESLFCQPEFIESFAADVFGKLYRANLLRDLDVEAFASAAADLLGDLNALHPFREGNGRAQRAFLSQLARQAGHRLIWSELDEQRNIDASIAAQRGDLAPLRALVRDALDYGRS